MAESRGSHLAFMARGAQARGLTVVLGLLVGLPSVAVLVRALGVKEYGALAYALGIVNLAGAVSDLGVGQGVTRLAAHAGIPADARWARIGTRLALMSGTLVTLLVLSGGILVPLDARIALFIAAPLVLVTAFKKSVAGFLAVRRQIMIREATEQARYALIAGFSIALAGLGLATIARIATVHLLIGTLAAVALVPRWFRLTRGPSPSREQTARGLLRFSLPLLLGMISFQAVQRSDVIMLGAIANTTAVGLYAPVLRLVDAIWLAVVVFGAYYLPVASAIVGSGDLGQLRSVYTTMTKWAVALVAPALAVLLVAPVPVLTLVFGPPFRETGLLSQVLAIGYVVSVLGGFNGATLVALGRTKAIAIRSTAALALNLTVNAILIPRLGALGAAVGTSIAYVGLNVANSYLIWRVARVHPLRRDFLAVVGASALAVAATIPVLVILDWWRSLAGSLLVAAVVGVASLGTAILTAGPEERDLMRLRNVLPRRFVKSSGSHH